MRRRKGPDRGRMKSPSPGSVTRILETVNARPEQAADELLPLVYDQLRKLALHRMAHERPGHTLQATALVHEAYLRLIGDEDPGWANLAHFFRAASEAMRRILIDHARKCGRVKRGGGKKRVPICTLDLADTDALPELLALDEALERLAVMDPALADLVRMRFYVGLSLDDTAHCLGVSRSTVKRDWRVARAWLHREMTEA